MASTPPPSATPKEGSFARTVALLLRPFAEVKPIEVAGVLLLTGTAFILMAAYYFLKVTREPLVLAAPGGAMVKSFASAGQALLLVFMTRAYRALANRLARRPLTIAVYGFFAGLIVLFGLAERAHLPIGVPFFLFVGIFNLTVLSQFWSVANDFYTNEEGKRIFAMLGIGTATGAIVGSVAGGKAFEWFGTTGPLVASVVLLVLGLGGVLAADKVIRERGGGDGKDDAPATNDAPADQAGSSERGGAPQKAAEGSIFGIDRYLFLLAFFILALNAFNAMGEYLLDRVMSEHVMEKLHTLEGDAAKQEFATFKSMYFTAFNALTLFLQLFIASRAIKWLGAKNAVFILPLVALAGYGIAAFVPILHVILWVKVAENAVDYSIENTSWQAMFLVLTRREKYVAKNVIDTVFVRFGDMTAAGLIFIFGKWLKMPTITFIILNLVIGGFWLFMVWLTRIEYPKKAERTAKITGENPLEKEEQKKQQEATA